MICGVIDKTPDLKYHQAVFRENLPKECDGIPNHCDSNFSTWKIMEL